MFFEAAEAGLTHRECLPNNGVAVQCYALCSTSSIDVITSSSRSTPIPPPSTRGAALAGAPHD